MVAALKTGTQNASYKQAVYTLGAVKPRQVELDREFVLNEQQYKHFTQCMSNPQAPTARMLESHSKLQNFLKNSN